MNAPMERRARDEAQVSAALRRLKDVADLRPSTAAPAASRPDPLADSLGGALAVIAEAEGFDLRLPPADDHASPLFDRLGRYANSSRFRFREIALTAGWWKKEGPAILAIARAGGAPCALVWRRGSWRAIDPVTRAETAIGTDAATAYLPRAYMIYPSLPAQVTTGQVWRFAVFGVRGDVSRLLIATAAATLAALLIPIATSSVLGFAVPDGRMSLLADMMIILVAAAIGSAGFQIVRSVALIRLGTHIDLRLQAAVWDRVLRLRLSFFGRYEVGDLALRILGIDAIRRVLAGQAVHGLIGGVFSLASLVLMLIYDVWLGLFATGYALVAAGILFVLGRQQLRLERNYYAGKGFVAGLLMEILAGMAKLRVAGAELRAFARWSHAFADQRAHDSGPIVIRQTVVATTLPIFGTLCILAIAGGGAAPIDFAAFAGFNSAFGQLTAALLGLTASVNAAVKAKPLYERARPIFDEPFEIGEDRIDPGTLSGAIAVHNLSFRYSADGPWALENIDFDVRPGEHVAIVGASGSGKSTLLRLLMGFEPPAQGGVYYDDKALETLDVRLVRRQIGAVLESADLIPGRIFDNIVGSASLTRAQVTEAVRLVGLEADLANMPMGLETVVMEGASQLSGGQRQRVMLARALVNQPRLIFLDQATSALDHRTQAAVHANLAAMNATRIVVAHQLSVIREADRILVLEKGRIVQSGTYDQLIGQDGAFHRLVHRQLL